MITQATNANTSAYKQLTGLRTQLISDLGIKKINMRQKQIISPHKYHIRKAPLTQGLRYIVHEQGIFCKCPRSCF